MRLALISAFVFDTTVGGVENHIRFLAKELQARGHKIAIFKPIWGGDAPLIPSRTVDGLTIYYIRIGRKWVDFQRWSGSGFLGYAFALCEKLSFLLATGALAKAVEEWNPEIVWQHDFFSSWLAARRLSHQYPVVLTNHQGQYLIFAKSKIGRLILNRLLAAYAAIIGPSAELTPAFAVNATTIHNGVDISYFKAADVNAREKLRESLYGVQDEQFIVFCPRRWAPNKGVAYFARALKSVETRCGPNSCVFVFAGNAGALYPRYRQEVEEALIGVKSRKIYLGDVDAYEMLYHYQASDLVVIPSILEAVSLSALEAMACGVAVLATNVGGMPEIISDGRTGYLVPAKDSSALAERLVDIVRDSRRGAIADAGRNFVRSNYSWCKIADLTEEVLLTVHRQSKRCIEDAVLS